MSGITPTKFPCYAEVSSNQYSADVVCHAIGVGKDGSPFALIERSDGTVQVLSLDGCYHIKLLGSAP